MRVEPDHPVAEREREPARDRRGRVVGMPLDLDRPGRARPRARARGRAAGRRARCPATQAAADEPSPRSSGIRLTPWSATPGTMAPPARGRVRDRPSRPCRCRRSGSSSGALAPPTSTPGARRRCRRVTSFHRSSARPKQSNPGPRFAEVAGTRAVSFTASEAELRGDGRGVGGDGRGLRRAGDRPLRVLQTVTGQHADHGGAARELPVGVQVEQAGDARRARRLGEQPLARDAPVGRQDLAIGDGEDLPLGLRRGRDRLVPRRRVPDADRRGDRLRILDRPRRARSAPPPAPGTRTAAAARRSRRRAGTRSSPASGWRCCPRSRPARSGCRARGPGSRRSRTRPSSDPRGGTG